MILERHHLAGGKGNVKELLDEAERDWVTVAGEPLDRLRKSPAVEDSVRRRA